MRRRQHFKSLLPLLPQKNLFSHKPLYMINISLLERRALNQNLVTLSLNQLIVMTLIPFCFWKLYNFSPNLLGNLLTLSHISSSSSSSLQTACTHTARRPITKSMNKEKTKKITYFKSHYKHIWARKQPIMTSLNMILSFGWMMVGWWGGGRAGERRMGIFRLIVTAW